jgi:hypothetical protein
VSPSLSGPAYASSIVFLCAIWFLTQKECAFGSACGDDSMSLFSMLSVWEFAMASESLMGPACECESSSSCGDDSMSVFSMLSVWEFAMASESLMGPACECESLSLCQRPPQESSTARVASSTLPWTPADPSKRMLLLLPLYSY